MEEVDQQRSKAIRYTLDLWECLVLFLGNGRLETDNNLTENAIRPTAVGNKNGCSWGGKTLVGAVR